MGQTGNGAGRLPNIPLYGRDAELGFIRDMLVRPERDGAPENRHVPALVFTGSRGVGKSALLNGLAERLVGNVPVARFDCERLAQHLEQSRGREADAAVLPKMLAALAFQLSRSCPNYGPLGFPRFITGHLALEPDLSSCNTWEEARQKVDAAVSRYRQLGDPPDYLRDLAGELAKMIPGAEDNPLVETVARGAPDLLYGRINKVLRRQAVKHKDGRHWYADQDRGLRLLPLDELVELNRQARDRGGDERDAVGHALCGALLADLREGFAAGRHADVRTLNCAILLDNVDEAPGREFLSRLVDAHGYRSSDVGFDPLTVVATSRTPLAELDAQFGRDPVPMREATPANAVGNGHRGRDVFSIRLGDLPYEAVGNMVTALGPRVLGDRRAATAIYDFTRGHAAATRLLLDAIVELEFTQVSLTGLLDRTMMTGPDSQPRTVAEHLLSILAQETPDDVLNELVTASAARDLDEAERMADDSELMPGSRNRHEAVFARTVWSHVDDVGRVTMAPMLRRLLLRKLAARGAQAFQQVHSWLHESCRRRGDQAGELYHLLALGGDGLESVARRMTEQFAELGTREWLDRLNAICQAPNAFEPGPTPAERVRLLTSWSDASKVSPDTGHDPRLLAAVARLLAALWITGDPLQQAARDLREEIRADLLQLAAQAGDGRPALLEEANKAR